LVVGAADACAETHNSARPVDSLSRLEVVVFMYVSVGLICDLANVGPKSTCLEVTITETSLVDCFLWSTVY